MTTHASGQLLEQLVAEGLVTDDRLDEVRQRATQGVREEDSLVELGIIDENDLLRWLARKFQTRFVATAKLAKVEVDRTLLEMVPRKLAEQLQVFPVLFQPNTNTLSVVSADPMTPGVARAVQQSARVSEVRIYVARPASVRAAILKHYGGDLYAFAQIDSQGREQYLNLMQMYERNTVDPDNMGPVFPSAPSASDGDRASGVNGGAPLGSSIAPAAYSQYGAPGSQVAPLPPLPPHGHGPPPGSGDLSYSVRIPLPSTLQHHQIAPPWPTRVAFMEMATVLVSLLENTRGELRGHSALVSRLMRKLVERMRLADDDVQALALAALLHDVGKASTYHITALNVAVFESHRTVAQKVYLTPVKLFDGVPLPHATATALQGMYESFDGRGFPDGLSGKDIPLGARMLAVVDTYADLTQNPRNPYRRKLNAGEAVVVLEQHRDTIFDRTLVDLLRQTVSGDDLRARLLAERITVLLVEPDAEESTVLELRLLEEGFEVRITRTLDEAVAALARGHVEVVICETEVDNASGFDLLARVRQGTVSAQVPWIFLTRDARRESVALGYEGGANDYVLKPASADVLVAKVRQLLAQRTGRQSTGVSGSLAELAFTDVVQVLSQGRKSGVLRLRSGTETGEVHLSDGAVFHAQWGGQRGEAAFFSLIRLTTGEFALDPTARVAARTIQSSVEMLLLEGLRRFDEASKT